MTLDDLNRAELHSYARQLGVGYHETVIDLAGLRVELAAAARLAPDRTPPGRLL